MVATDGSQRAKDAYYVFIFLLNFFIIFKNYKKS